MKSNENVSFDNLPLMAEAILRRVENIEKAISQLKEIDREGDEKFLNIDDAAEFIHLSKATIYTLVSKKIIPHQKRGKRLYFSKAALKEWICKPNSASPIEEMSIDQYLSTFRTRRAA